MKQTKLLMGMPISVDIVGPNATKATFKKVYEYFTYIDNTYSTYKGTSEISQINNGLPKSQWSEEMKMVLSLCERTKRETNGYFNIEHSGKLDPSGLVKGWAIKNAADIVAAEGFRNYFIDAGGDIQVSGKSLGGKPWRVGIRNPFNRNEIIKTVVVTTEGVATSGTYIRGQHIYNPHAPDKPIDDIVSMTVIGPDIYNADRFATAAYAMGKGGIVFIEKLDGYEAYMVDNKKMATYTSGFERYVVPA
jgi:thiamine biosynthesis lipoprotein